jgi:hypothetical protein
MATAVAYMKRLSSMQTKPECVAHNQQQQKNEDFTNKNGIAPAEYAT